MPPLDTLIGLLVLCAVVSLVVAWVAHKLQRQRRQQTLADIEWALKRARESERRNERTSRP